MNISFIIPCYNEEKNVKLIYDAIENIFLPKNISYECVFINDGSKDQTGNELKKLFSEHSGGNVKVINFSRNFGKEAAIFCGIHHAEGDYVCFIDCDLQQNPSVALSMYEKLRENPDYDCVAAYQDERKEGKTISFFKKMFYRIINKMCDVDFKQGASDFRMCRKNMIQAILEVPEYSRFSKGIFAWVGFNTLYMPYTAEDRKIGTSKWTFRSLFKYAVDGIVGYTTLPLRFATILGSIISVFSIIYMLVVILKALIAGVDTPGYTTTVGLILLLGGIQLLMLGIIGEYLARTYIQVKNRPIYIEREVLEKKE